MSRAVDRWQPRYIDNQPVANGATLTGTTLQLDAASGLSVQVLCSGGAAGSVNIDCTNQDGTGLNFVTPTTQTVAANGSLYLSFGPADQATVFAQMRVRFVASAAGNVTVATNIRRAYP